MNQQAELLEQFVIESRDCLEQIGERLLQVERAPDDAALLNDLFRLVHTLKGNCGLFEFKPMERVVHAGEDLLDRVRNHTLPYTNRMADLLLDAMDFTVGVVDQIASRGRIDPQEDERSRTLAAALRELLATPAAAPDALPATLSTHATSAPPTAEPVERPAPAWLERLPAELRAAHPQAVALRYLPEPTCFFKGEDPWRLAQTTPGLLHLALAPCEPWPTGEALAEFDCYHCNLDLVLLSSATPAEVAEHYRYVPEQVDAWTAPVTASVRTISPAVPVVGEPEAPATIDLASLLPAPLVERLQALWQDQRALLERTVEGGTSGTSPGMSGVARAARAALAALLDIGRQAAAQAGPEVQSRLQDSIAQLDALPADAGCAALAELSRRHGPFGPVAAVESDARSGDGADADAAPSGALAASAVGSGSGGTDGGRRGEDGGDRGGRTLKVSQDKIDRLMDLIGEMVVAKNALPYLATRAETVFGQRELSREIKARYAVINRIAEDMQHAIMQVRMMPVGVIFQRYGRLVRDLSRKLGKEVRLVVEGEDTEADKNVIEALADPLIHLMRNSLDHGIEMPEVRLAAGKPLPATIRVRARQESDRVVIEIEDDGAGIDTAKVRAKAVERGLIPADKAATLSEQDAVQLIFLPGFSTVDTISDLSGRGVGMDVVRSAIERINGQVSLSSVPGQGATVRLSLPLSMAVTNVMIIEAAGRTFGVPMDLIVETVRVHADDIHRFKQAATTVLRNRIVPLRPLNALLSLDDEPRRNDDGEYAVLVVRLLGENVGLLVDDFHGATDIILKPLEGVLSGLTGFAGTALMGDGSVLMVLNPKELI